MVGVQGAGLQWVYFLPEHSAILEIGWKRWPSKYVYRGQSVGVQGKFIDASENITMNWSAYEKANKLEQLTDRQKQDILGNNKLLFDKNPYKWADTHIGIHVYLRHLRNLITKLEIVGVKF